MYDPVKDLLFETALKYCRMRLLPWDELGYEETVEYGLRRSHLHTTMSNLLDVDRELIERAFTKAESKFGARVVDGFVVDHSIRGDFDFAKAYDDFCKELMALEKLSERERHPNELTDEELDKMDLSGICEMPNTATKETDNGKRN